MSQVICQVFRGSKKADMYLYVDKKEGLERVSEPLLKLFGTPVPAMVLLLNKEKKLLRAEVTDVMQQIQEKGFYLQMPPVQDSEMQEIALKNTKLER